MIVLTGRELSFLYHTNHIARDRRTATTTQDTRKMCFGSRRRTHGYPVQTMPVHQTCTAPPPRRARMPMMGGGGGRFFGGGGGGGGGGGMMGGGMGARRTGPRYGRRC